MAAPNAGLTARDAAARLMKDGPNELPLARKRTMLRQTWDVVRQPMLLLLLAAGTINFALAEPLDGLVLMGSVVLVIAISVVQEHRTENALAALRDLSSPRALVVRDGIRVRIPGRDVVRGDVIVLAEGDRVPADGVMVEAVNVSVDESALTGESVPVPKAAADRLVDTAETAEMGRPGGDGTPWVFSGTLLVKGRGMAVARGTGASTELGRIGTALGTIVSQRTRLQGEVDRLVRVVAVVGLATAAAVVGVYTLTRGHWLEGLLAGIATAMALLPEEFPVVLTVFLALGAWRMSQRRVLTRRSAVIEALGAATVICVDKTGTLTMNRMTVNELIADGDVHRLDDGPLPSAFHRLAEYAVLASPTEGFDPMDSAFVQLGRAYLDGTKRLHPDWQLAGEFPLSPGLMAMSQIWQPVGDHARADGADGSDGAGGDYLLAAKGAPEAVAELCRLPPSERARLTRQVQAATAGGQRVLAVAAGRWPRRRGLPARQQDVPFELLGLAGLHDPVRPGVVEAVADCHRAGVRVIMITGDYPGTALAIAREIGLEAGRDGGPACLTGGELAAMDDAELAERIGGVTVFARMVPEQKLQLIRVLKAGGEIVGMTGDGVNDAPALRAADIGVAMGARGTDVAREAADLVITDDDFTSIVGGIRRGRGIFDNLRKAMSYIIAVHVPIFGISLLPVFVADWPLVLLPVQIAFLELIIDPACSIVFESEQIDPKIMDNPPRGMDAPMFDRRALSIAAGQGVSALAAVLAVYLWAVLSERPDDVVRSVTFAALVLGNLALILVNRSWRLSAWQALRQRRNRALPWILTAAATLLVATLTLPWLRTAFDLGPIAPGDWLVALAAGFAGVAWFEIYKRFHSARNIRQPSM